MIKTEPVDQISDRAAQDQSSGNSGYRTAGEETAIEEDQDCYRQDR